MTKKGIDRDSAESNIHELEHCGLERCPDRGFHGFKRYVTIAIVAYNLKRIGREMLRKEQNRQLKKDRTKKTAGNVPLVRMKNYDQTNKNGI